MPRFICRVSRKSPSRFAGLENPPRSPPLPHPHPFPVHNLRLLSSPRAPLALSCFAPPRAFSPSAFIRAERRAHTHPLIAFPCRLSREGAAEMRGSRNVRAAITSIFGAFCFARSCAVVRYARRIFDEYSPVIRHRGHRGRRRLARNENRKSLIRSERRGAEYVSSTLYAHADGTIDVLLGQSVSLFQTGPSILLI